LGPVLLIFLLYRIAFDKQDTNHICRNLLASYGADLFVWLPSQWLVYGEKLRSRIHLQKQRARKKTCYS